MADSQSPLGACALERELKVGPQAFAKATVLHRERMGECPSSNANRTRSQRHGSVNAVQPFGCGLPLLPSSGYYQANGGVMASGTYSGNVYLIGSFVIYGHDKATDKLEIERLALLQRDFSPDPMNFPGQNRSSVVNGPQVGSNF